jgi:uncharacterized RmlC-like cupin family protein
VTELVKVMKLEQIPNPDGFTFPIYRNWDEWHGGHVPKMVYATTINPKTKKDIILHERRTAMITAISGVVRLQYRLLGADYFSNVWLRTPTESRVVLIQPGIPIELTNSGDEVAVVINAPSPAWHPDDQDTIKFKTWDEYFAYVKERDSK